MLLDLYNTSLPTCFSYFLFFIKTLYYCYHWPPKMDHLDFDETKIKVTYSDSCA